MNMNRYIVPARFRRFYKKFAGINFTMLDIGTIGGAISLAKLWFPKSRYYGLDITEDHLTAEDRANMEGFFLVNLETDDLSRLEDNFFDVIVMSHVVEHITNALDVLAILSRKLKPGGVIYIEFPSVRSLNLPNARHTLNFSDDPTHIRIYDVRDIANVLMANGLRIIRGGRRREWLRIFLSVFNFPAQVVTYLREGRLHGIGLWDLMGFADFVYARKPLKPQADGDA